MEFGHDVGSHAVTVIATGFMGVKPLATKAFGCYCFIKSAYL